MVGQKRPFTPAQVKQIKRFLTAENRTRDLTLFSVGLDTMLRGSDLLGLRVQDLVVSGKVKDRAHIKQQKTGKTVTVQLQPDTKALLLEFVEKEGKEPEDFLFTGRKQTGKPISLIQYSRLVKLLCHEIGLEPESFSTHSIRKTKPALIYDKTKNIEVCRQALGHSNCSATSHYLGIDKNKALDIAAEFVL